MSSSRLVNLFSFALPLVPGLSLAQAGGANPACALAEVDTTVSEVVVGWGASSRLADFVEDGASWRVFTAEGRTLMRLSPSLAAWGRAAYVRGVRADVAVSESSDFAEVGPMAVADTVGGDKDSESYRFRAGFAWRLGQSAVGLDIRYSSLSEFRTHDPRPKADAVVAEARLGGAFFFSGGQSVGLFGALRKYSQELDIDFKNDRNGNATVYHLIGLGADYSRFAGANTGASYDGRRAGGGFSFSGPVDVTVEVSRRHTEKSLPGLQNVLINETFDNCVEADAARHGLLNGWRTRLEFRSAFNHLTLNTAIYDDGVRNYRLLAKREPYERKSAVAGLSASLSRPESLSLNAFVSCSADKEANSELSRRVEVADVSLGVSAEARRKWRSASLVGGLGLKARRNVRCVCDLGARRANESAPVFQSVRRDLSLRSANLFGGDASARVDFRHGGWPCAPFVDFSVGGFCRSGALPDAWHFELRAGVGF